MHQHRDRLIVALISWLRENGHATTDGQAKQMLADATGLSYEYVEDILEKSRK